MGYAPPPPPPMGVPAYVENARPSARPILRRLVEELRDLGIDEYDIRRRLDDMRDLAGIRLPSPARPAPPPGATVRVLR